MDEIVDGVHQVGAGVNAFVIDGDEGVVLIDTGLPGRHGAIVDGLAAIGRRVGDITAIVVTHSHADHTGGAAALKRRSGAELAVPAIEADVVRGWAPTPLPPVLDRPVLRLLGRLVPTADPTGVDYAVVGRGPVPVVADLLAVPTPGHTPGHTSYLLDRAGGVLFVGDAAVATRRGEVRRGLMNRASEAFDASLRTLAELDFAVACFGHSAPLRSAAAHAFRRFAATLG